MSNLIVFMLAIGPLYLLSHAYQKLFGIGIHFLIQSVPTFDIIRKTTFHNLKCCVFA